MQPITRNVSREALQATLRRYLREIWRQKKWYLPAIILPGIGSVLALFAPTLIVSKILSHYETYGSLDQASMIRYVTLFSCVWFSGEMLWRVSEWFNEKGQYRSLKKLYLEALEQLLQRDISFFNNNFAGSLTKRALDYARNFEDFADKLGKSIGNIVITFIFSFIVLWQFSPWISLALIVCFAITLYGSIFFLKQRMQYVIRRNAAGNKAAGTLSDIISNIFAVKMFGREKDEYRNYKQDIIKYSDLQLKSWKIWNERHDMFVSPMYVFTNAFGLVLAIHFGQSMGVSSAAIFITFNYFGRITRSLWELGPLYQQLERQVSDAAEHVQAVSTPLLVTDSKNARDLTIHKAVVSFQDTTFYYGDDKDQSHLFSNLSFTVKSGEKLGLVGVSGGGKTTITKLLLRFMDIQGGTITIDGQDISKVTQESLRKAISYVPQEPMLFHRTLAENIRYGKLDATDEEVTRAAKLAHAHEFIKGLPSGYDTLVGERGVKLSGGQRQRVAIARAILKDAPILVLDEATSALDSESEKLIQDALNKLMKNRTSIVIAHRLSTIQKMDRIIVLDKGQIIEEGSHTELLAMKGTYAKLWAHQSGGFLEE